MLGQLGAILKKDFTLELRSKEMILAMLVFGLIVLVIFYFSFDTEEPIPIRVSAGIVWLAFIFA